MTFDEYQKQAIATDTMGGGVTSALTDAAYVAKILGLVGEAGEVAEKYKKLLRDSNGAITARDKAEITKELGDVMWYIAVLAHYLGVPLESVADANLTKLSSRKQRDALHGKGDNR